MPEIVFLGGFRDLISIVCQLGIPKLYYIQAGEKISKNRLKDFSVKVHQGFEKDHFRQYTARPSDVQAGLAILGFLKLMRSPTIVIVKVF